MKKSTPQIINNRLQGGIWYAEIIGAGDETPAVTAWCGTAAMNDLCITHEATRDVWQLTVPLPQAMLTDGTQTCLLKDAAGNTLASMTVIAGIDAAENLAAEVALLRAELDLLKSAFRDSQRKA